MGRKQTDIIATHDDLERYIEESGLRRDVFAKKFGMQVTQIQSWKRIGRISKRGYQLLLSIVKTHPEIYNELDAINAEIDKRERRRK